MDVVILVDYVEKVRFLIFLINFLKKYLVLFEDSAPIKSGVGVDNSVITETVSKSVTLSTAVTESSKQITVEPPNNSRNMNA